MFTIGKFSQLVRVSPRMLRHYEKCGLFYPAKIDKINGYRFYSANQIPLLLRIIALRDMGFSIEEIGDIVDNYNEKDYIKKILKNKALAIQELISEELKKIDLLGITLENVEEGNYTTTCKNVILKEIPNTKVLSIREVLPDYSYQEELWEKLFNFIAENDLNLTIEKRAICIYHDHEYKETDVDIEVAVIVNELCESNGDFVFKELEAITTAATVICNGPYVKILPEGEELLAQWIEENGYEITGSERVYAIRHPYNEEDPNNYQTEIQFPIRKRF